MKNKNKSGLKGQRGNLIAVFLTLVISLSPIAFASQESGSMTTDIISDETSASGAFSKVTPIGEDIASEKSEKVTVYAVWKNNPSACPILYEGKGQQCSQTGQVMCGVNPAGDTLQCYQSSSLNPPSTSASVSTQQTATLSGGYIINCDAYDSLAPFCDNSGAFWCNADPSCSTKNRMTQCTASQWNAFSCGACIAGYNNCDTTNDNCEINNGASCGANTGKYNGCLTVGAGGVGNCTSTTNLDCNNDDSDGLQSTCNGPNGCEISPSEGCTVAATGLTGACQGCGNLGTDSGGNLCNCIAGKSYFQTGTKVVYSTSDPLLWGAQLGSGWMMNFTNSAGNVFGVNNSGCIVFADGSVQCNAAGEGGNVSFNQSLTDDIYVPYQGADKTVDLNNQNLTSVNRMGIGTTTPGEKLDVNGNVLINGALHLKALTAAPFACNSTNKGSMYFNDATNMNLICNGTSWNNYTGPQGEQGPIGLTGPQGPAGIDGTNGSIGPQGIQGLQGLTGPQGSPGINGTNGAVGPQGPQGPAGINGTDGAVGPQGPIGLTGPQGTQGPAGINGTDGAVGPQGPAGPVAGSNMQFVYNNNGFAGGAEVYYNNSKVGIGTAAPRARLEVNGELIINGSKTSNQGQLTIIDQDFPSTNTMVKSVILGYGNDANIENGGGKLWSIGSYGGTGGNMGIQNFIQGKQMQFISKGGDFVFLTAPAQPGGNVGIGIVAPSEKLYVSGNIKATGDICTTSGKCLNNLTAADGNNYTSAIRVTGEGTKTITLSREGMEENLTATFIDQGLTQETDPAWTGNQSSYYNITDIQNNYYNTSEIDQIVAGAADGTGGWTNVSGKIYTTNPTDKVGIGTATPNQKLEVNGSVNITGNIDLTENITMKNGRFINFLNSGGQFDETRIYKAGGNALRINYATNNMIFRAANNTDLLIVNSSDTTKFRFNVSAGKFMINGGASMPNQELEVVGSANLTGNITVGRGIILGGVYKERWDDVGNISWNESYADTKYVPYTGATQNVDLNNKNLTNILQLGIGTATPNATLYVNGTIYFEGGSGDIDNNGYVDGMDSASCLQRIENSSIATLEEILRGDMNGDGFLSQEDCEMIAKKEAEMLEPYADKIRKYGSNGDDFIVNQDVVIGNSNAAQSLTVYGTGVSITNTSNNAVLCLNGNCVASLAAANNYTSAISVTGTGTKTITLARQGMAENLTATFIDQGLLQETDPLWTGNQSSYYNKTDVQNSYYNKTQAYNKTEVYNKTQVYNKTEGYNKTEVYNKAEVDAKIVPADGTGGWTNNSQNTTTMLRVGIGTDQPGQELHIKSPDYAGMIIEGANDSGIELKYAQGHTGGIFMYSDDSAEIPKSAIYGNNDNDLYIKTYKDTDILFQTNGTEKMRITSDGDVGIGTPTPSQKLEVMGNASINGNVYVNNRIAIEDDGNYLCFGGCP